MLGSIKTFFGNIAHCALFIPHSQGPILCGSKFDNAEAAKKFVTNLVGGDSKKDRVNVLLSEPKRLGFA